MNLLKKAFKKMFYKNEVDIKQPEVNAVINVVDNVSQRNDYFSKLFDSYAQSKDKFIAVKETGDDGILTIHLGYIVGKSLNKLGVLCPKIKDVITGDIVSDPTMLIEFQDQHFYNLSKLSKAQFLALFKKAHLEIDQETKDNSQFLEKIIGEDEINKLISLGFYDINNQGLDISCVTNFWNDDSNFEYKGMGDHPKIVGKEDSNIRLDLDMAQHMLNEKSLLMYISNENTTPDLSLLVDIDVMKAGTFPILKNLLTGEETFAFGLPHYYSKTLESCFEVLPKHLLQAVLHGIQKPDLPKDIETGRVFTSYSNFQEQLIEQKEKYKKLLLS